MNIYDISEKAGVSIATVSRVLNGSDKVSEKTKRKVRKVMEEMNYTPNIFARGLGLNSMKVIGILCPDASDPYLANAVYYAEQALKAAGYDTLLSCCGYQLEERKKALQLLMSKRIDGIMLIGSSFVEKNVENCAYIQEAAQKVPVVLVNGYMEGENIYCSFCNDFQAVFQVTNELLDKGRNKILFLYRTLSYSGRQKLEGYRAALRARGIEPEEQYQVQMEREISDVKEQLRELYRSGSTFDAILSSEDTFAVAGMKFAKEEGLSIPKELEIIGYNNSILAQATEPELTSIDSRVKDTTESGVALMMGALNEEMTEKKVCIPCQLIKRGTTDF